ncbi:MAG: hypothetical protein ACKV2U_30720 [Bryobacteraceae bacterium]
MKHSKTFAVALGGMLMLSAQLSGDVIIDLKNGVVTETFNTAPLPAAISGDGLAGYQESSGYAGVTLAKKTGSGCSSTPYEAHVMVNLAPASKTPLKKLSILVEYEGTPSQWHTHIGDDAANNGYGGGNGLAGIAELQVVGQDLAVYSVGLAPGKVDKLYGAQVRLTEGALHFNVANQELSIGQPYTILQSPYQKQLFDFGATDKKLFAGFNRVIANDPSRTGCGAKKVHLSFE